MRIVSEVSRELGRVCGPQYVASGVEVKKSEKDGNIEYVVSGTASVMSDAQLNVFKREDVDEQVAPSKLYYLLFGIVVEPGENVVIIDKEGRRIYDVNNLDGRWGVPGGLLLNISPMEPAFRYIGTVTNRDGATYSFTIVSGFIEFGRRGQND